MTARGWAMRPMESSDDSTAATRLFVRALSEDEQLAARFPEGGSARPVAVAEDGSAALIDLYAGPNAWPEFEGDPVARVVVVATTQGVSAA
ncbi:MAG: hypothetical protein ACREM2_04170 [Vulcanimicrobiaceae bacterium]